MPRITKRVVDKISPASKDVFLWDEGDGALKGFGIRIKPSGTASYLVQYRNKEGRTRRLVIGKVGTLTPEEARELAREKLAAVSKGADPSADRHAIREAITVAELCDLYLKDAAHRIKPSTLALDRIRIESHVKPLLGKRTVRSLTPADLAKFQNDIAVGKTAKPKRKKGPGGHTKGGRGAAGRTFNMFRTILEFARRNKIITENPARDVRQLPSEKRRRFLSFDEIKALNEAMHSLEEEGRASPTGNAAIRALLLTGCRKNEILALPWTWFDSRCIRFGDTKTGAQLRPIGATAAEFIAAQSKRAQWVFPADKGDGHFIGAPKLFRRACKRAKIEGASLHTLRHTFAAIAAELGFSELTIAGLLGHTVPGITARYAHVPDRALLSAADTVAARIAAALEGQQEGMVIQLQQSRLAHDAYLQ